MRFNPRLMEIVNIITDAARTAWAQDSGTITGILAAGFFFLWILSKSAAKMQETLLYAEIEAGEDTSKQLNKKLRHATEKREEAERDAARGRGDFNDLYEEKSEFQCTVGRLEERVSRADERIQAAEERADERVHIAEERADAAELRAANAPVITEQGDIHLNRDSKPCLVQIGSSTIINLAQVEMIRDIEVDDTKQLRFIFGGKQENVNLVEKAYRSAAQMVAELRKAGYDVNIMLASAETPND